jgi:hypothetical protein
VACSALRIIRLSPPDPIANERAYSLKERQLGRMVLLVDDLMDVNRITLSKVELRRRGSNCWR